MRVRAIDPGFYDLHKNRHPIDIKVGQEFDIPEGAKIARWMEKVEPVEAGKPAPAGEKPPVDPKPSGKPAPAK